ncbi:DUF1833 family protein [Pseudoxanthomonas sp. USHLN014]|uniref:DUF1833 family protein n=1 Tax=Pseudoxanthomonas sp. USHLN014 TaxID=3081297 RepID=UPI00301E4CFD
MRQLSPAAARAVLSAETEEVFLACLSITHPAIDTIRIVNNTETVMRLAGEFTPYPFQSTLPTDNEDAPGTVTITIDNVDREVARLIRNLEGIPAAVLEVVLASSPDVVEVGPFDFDIVGADIDVMTVQLTAGYVEDFVNQGVPAQTYTPSNSKGLWP